MDEIEKKPHGEVNIIKKISFVIVMVAIAVFCGFMYVYVYMEGDPSFFSVSHYSFKPTM